MAPQPLHITEDDVTEDEKNLLMTLTANVVLLIDRMPDGRLAYDMKMSMAEALRPFSDFIEASGKRRKAR
jgi:hypothetical protein